MTNARQVLGRAGEQRALEWYEARGWMLVDRNWRCRDGEVDLILTSQGTLVFCEVKTRSSLKFGHPAEAVTYQKSQRIRRLAARWLAEHRHQPVEIRFDIAAVLPDRIEVIEAAF